MSEETKAAKQTLVPEIRFEGFSGEWESIKLGAYNDVTKLAGYEFTKYVQYSDEGYIPAVRGLNVKNEEVFFEDVKYIDNSDFSMLNRSRLETGDVLYTYVGTIGEAAVVPENVKWYLAPNVCRIRPSEDVDGKFIMFVLVSEKFKSKELLKWVSTTSQASLSMRNIREFNITVPEKEEQNNIGHLLGLSNEYIKGKQKELTKLQNFKQAMLQKLFPKEGEKEPEMRFEGFEGEWVECTINDIGMIITGNTPSTSEASNYTDKGIPWITPTDIKSNNNVRAAKTLSNAGAQKARVVPEGSILVTCIASIGKNTIVLEESGFNQQINAVIPNNDLDSYFLLALSVHWSNSMKKIAGAGTMDIVNRTEFSKIKTYIPHYTEQKQIGDYFYKLDQNIQSKQAELKKLKQFKQAMLSKLFV